MRRCVPIKQWKWSPARPICLKSRGALEQVAMQARDWFQRKLKHEEQYGGK